jgi:hypothetical protein
MSRPSEVPQARTPQRRNGKLRVAAILKAGEAVIAEKGYEAATMAEIAARSNTKIGSLYRFFPNKEVLANALILQGPRKLPSSSYDGRPRTGRPANEPTILPKPSRYAQRGLPVLARN